MIGQSSTHSTFYLKEAVVNFRETKEPLKMFTNGGSITYHHIVNYLDMELSGLMRKQSPI